jgi:hypothetical protein
MQQPLPMNTPRIRCNSCKVELDSIEQVDATGLRGIELGFKANCAACDQETWAVRGEAPSVRAFYEALEKAAGHKVQLGSTSNGSKS